MSTQNGAPGTPDEGQQERQSATAATAATAKSRAEPRPEPIRFYGTTWVDHTGGYALRRVGLGLGALVVAAAGAFVLRLAYDGLAIAEVGSWVSILVVVAFAVCSSLAFSRTLGGYSRRDDGSAAAADSSLRSVKAVGFIGVLVAYALRTVVEAPGEKLLRAEYEEAVERHERLRSSRSRNPSAKRKQQAKGKRKR